NRRHTEGTRFQTDETERLRPQARKCDDGRSANRLPTVIAADPPSECARQVEVARESLPFSALRSIAHHRQADRPSKSCGGAANRADQKITALERRHSAEKYHVRICW